MSNGRKCLDLLLALILVLGWSVPVLADPAVLTDAQIEHLLNRISFGPVPGDIQAVRSTGAEAYIERQLRPDLLPPSPALDQRLAGLPTLNMPALDLATQYSLPGDQVKAFSPDQRKEYERRRRLIVEELAQAKILRAILSPAQLQEVMVDFWFNHFNVYAQKGGDNILISSYERDAIRPYALGKFRDLLNATAHHPAMLIYLDNQQNVAPNSMAGINAARHGKEVGINENYAREVMELHTLGVNGGYSQRDVTTLAHILSGWGVQQAQGIEGKTSFYFEPKRHDYDNQVWLGYNIPGGGEPEIELVLNMLATHPSTAHHIAYELAQYFVADDPPQSLVDKLTATYRSSDGDISQMLRTMFHAPEFWDAKYNQKKFKPPFRFVMSALRAADVVPPGDTRLIQSLLRDMGEPLYDCLTPNGYANTNDQWLNSDALLKRIDFDKKLAGYLDDSAAVTIYGSLGNVWSQNTLNTVRNADGKMRAALMLSSPEFVYY